MSTPPWASFRSGSQSGRAAEGTDRIAAYATLGLVVLAYAASLSGGWVWDDHILLVDNPALDSPLRLWTESLFGATSGTGNVYRPLVMMTFLPGYALELGPAFERVMALSLHLATVYLLARSLTGLGVNVAAAWLLAAVYGVHPGVSEVVAWISARQDLLPGVLTVAALAAWVHKRPWLAALFLLPTPFCKESFLLAAPAMGIWCLGSRRLHPAVALPALGAIGYAWLRAKIGLELPAGAVGADLLGALGSLARRLPELVCWPVGAETFPDHRPNGAIGAVAALGGVALTVGSWGRPRIAAATGLLVLALPGALAAAHTGLMSDRYLHMGVVSIVVLVAAAIGLRTPPRVLWSLPIGLAVITGIRAWHWTSDVRLFSAALGRDQANGRAAFHLGHALHRYNDDCLGAVPLYRRGIDADPRAHTNLQACYVALGDPSAALALTEAAAAAQPANPNPPANGARAAVAMGRLELAERWARVAVERDPMRVRNVLLLGNILGQQGRCNEALPMFRSALEIDPSSAGAMRGVAACQKNRTEEASAVDK
mgnify:CR=1 FL=1